MLCQTFLIGGMLGSFPNFGQDLSKIRDLRLQGKFVTAKKMAASAVQKRGSSCWQCNIELGMALFELGEQQKAYDHLRGIQKRQNKIRSRNDPRVLEMLIMISRVFLAQTDYYMAEYGWDRARIALENKPHPLKALNLAYLADYWRVQGNHDRAHQFFKQSEKALSGSEEAWTRIEVWKLRGIFEMENGHFELADRYLEKARRIAIHAFGAQSYQTLLVLVEIGNLALAQGDFEEALLLFQALDEAFQKVFEAPHLVQADVAQGLALACLSLGKARDGMPFAEKARKIRVSQLGAGHRAQIETTLLLAQVYLKTGVPAKALPLAEDAWANVKALYEDDHILKAKVHLCLGDCLGKLGQSAQARSHSIEGLSMAARLLGENHPEVLRLRIQTEGLNSEGVQPLSSEEYEAILLDLEADREDCHPTIAAVLGHLAKAKMREGHWRGALECLQRITRCQNDGLDLEFRDRIEHQVSMARCQSALGNEREFLQHVRRALDEEESWSQKVFSLSTERDHLAFFRDAQDRFSTLLELMLAPENLSQARLELSFEMVMRRKGWLLELTMHKRRSLAQLSPEDQKLFQRLTRIKKELSDIAQFLNSDRHTQALNNRIRKLRDEQLEVESALSGAIKLPPQATNHLSDRVVKAVPEGTCLIEVIKFGKTQPSYGAFWVSRSGGPFYDKIGPADWVEARIRTFRSAILGRDRHLFEKVGSELAKGFEPILANCGSSEILFSPDAEFHLIPMEALSWNAKFLVESFQISYINGGRSLLLEPELHNAGDIAIFSAADFGDPQGKKRFRFLEHTSDEARQIVNIMIGASLVLQQGKNASESNLKQTHSPRILHLATHGFYGDSPETSDAISLPNAIEDPLAGSGLAFAGANQNGDGEEDGILTGIEAVGLDLSGTELVVLSACSSARGVQISGEGVYGIQRAFRIAGANQIVASLWDVSDARTTSLMADFYANYKERAHPGAALRKAMLKCIEEFKKSGQTPDPRIWAAFIQSGIDRK